MNHAVLLVGILFLIALGMIPLIVWWRIFWNAGSWMKSQSELNRSIITQAKRDLKTPVPTDVDDELTRRFAEALESRR